MRDYAPTKGKYSLPRSVWNRSIWLIRDRDRLKAEADNLLYVQARPADPIPGKGGKADPVAKAAIKREKFLRQVEAVDDALEIVPPEYRKGVIRSVINMDPYPLDACRSTYSRWKSCFVYEVARRMNYL